MLQKSVLLELKELGWLVAGMRVVVYLFYFKYINCNQILQFKLWIQSRQDGSLSSLGWVCSKFIALSYWNVDLIILQTYYQEYIISVFQNTNQDMLYLNLILMS